MFREEETSPTAKSEEKRMFSQASLFSYAQSFKEKKKWTDKRLVVIKANNEQFRDIPVQLLLNKKRKIYSNRVWHLPLHKMLSILSFSYEFPLEKN